MTKGNLNANYMCLSDKALLKKSLDYFLPVYYLEKYERINLLWAA